MRKFLKECLIKCLNEYLNEYLKECENRNDCNAAIT